VAKAEEFDPTSISDQVEPNSPEAELLQIFKAVTTAVDKLEKSEQAQDQKEFNFYMRHPWREAQ